MTKFYVDAQGKYLGAWDGGKDDKGKEKDHPDVPPDATEVPNAPAHASQTWDGEMWSAPPPARWLVPKLLISRRLRAAGLYDVAMAALAEPSNADAKVDWTDGTEFYNDDAVMLALLKGIGADESVILAQP